MSALQTDFAGSGPSSVYVVRFGAMQPETAKRGALLDIGDELVSEGAGAAVELTCPKSASLNFSGAFRTVIVAPEGRDCAVNLLSGSLEVLTSDPTEAQAGDITMGSEHTVYGLQIIKRDGRPAAEAAVYDGDVKVSAPGRSQLVRAGYKIQSAMAQPVQMRREDFDRAATVWARLDMAKAQNAGAQIDDPRAAYMQLHAAYAKVLANAGDGDSRIALAGQQVNLGISRTALAQLNRAEAQQLAPSQTALLQFTRAAAFQQLGDQQQARASYETAVRLDPKVTERGMYLTKAVAEIKAQPPGGMSVRASANPPAIAPGAFTRIVVQVVSAQNAPIPAATVTVSSGGGTFRESGGTRVSGSTDANGQFATFWNCSPCAGGYAMSVEAAKQGYASATTSVNVAIQSAPVPLVLRVSAVPPSVAPGALTRILVQPLSPQNAPVPGTAITVAAGGGRFRESGTTQVSGYTDANGNFATYWSCSPCAGGYVMSVEAAKQGYASTTTSVNVGIQSAPAPAPMPLVLRVSAAPPSVAPGTITRILVQALSPQNAPVAGTAITVAAGGGRFRESGSTQVSGYTDANGNFAAYWSCSPCAAAYVLGIEARHGAFQPANTNLTIPVH